MSAESLRTSNLSPASCDRVEIADANSDAALLGTSFSAQIRFVQTFGDGSQTTWQALVVVVGGEQEGERPGLDPLWSQSKVADSRRPALQCPRELEMRAGRWWAGGRARGSPIGEWYATRHHRTAVASRRRGRRRVSLSRSPHSARSHSPEHGLQRHSLAGER